MMNTIKLGSGCADRLGVCPGAIPGARPWTNDRGSAFQFASFEGDCEDSTGDPRAHYHGIGINKSARKNRG